MLTNLTENYLISYQTKRCPECDGILKFIPNDNGTTVSFKCTNCSYVIEFEKVPDKWQKLS